MTGSTVVWSADEARVRLARRALTADVGVPHGEPVVIVDLDDEPLPDLPPTFPALVIGRRIDAPDHPAAAAPRGVDLALADATAGLAAAAVLDRPHAAVTLAQLLRISTTVPVTDALVAESLAYGVLQSGPEHQGWLSGRGRRVRPATDEPPIIVADTPERVRITLNRPRLRNAYDAAMRNALLDALRALDDPADARPIHVDAAGRSFCVGGDLAEFGTVADPSTAHHLRMATSVGVELHRLADRVTVTVHGASVGAGVELAAFAHRVAAHPDATFALPEVALGLVPGAGGTVSVARRVGRHRTLWFALTGATIDATTALDWGLIDSIAPAD